MTENAIRSLPPLVGEAPSFQAMLGQVSRAAPLDRPVLVIGERGTGKELVAARLHFLSRRWDRSLVTVNCAALSENLLESELFGHEAGAFTGAVRRRAGRFEQADAGSLFLDEIATSSPAVQEKMLRVIEYGAFERLGGGQAVAVDVRVIGATNADLPSLAAAGKFRADLLDRLAFDVITLPPLRARTGDIAILADHFAIGMSTALGRPYFAGFSRLALQHLQDHPWPGNVRELKNVVERAVYRASDPEAEVEEIILDPFASPFRPGGGDAGGCLDRHPRPGRPVPDGDPTASPEARQGGGQTGLTERVLAFERQLITAALGHAGATQKSAAAELGLGYHQFRRLLAKHRLNR
ncbi:MAG: phage shock protein operon transcriptional activator [Azospirillum sp.]|nr:phage shock protein operon transcriptional activator [Azospirillum sp.]